MKLFITIFISAFIISSSFKTNPLEEKEQTIELTYIKWACACPNWATQEDMKNHHENSKISIFIEPADKSLELPDTLGYNFDIIKFTGRFYKGKGFPKNCKSFKIPDDARMFRYTKYEVIKSNFRHSKVNKGEQE